MTNVDQQHRIGATPLDCANKVDDWAAICDFDIMYLQWDGEQMVADPALGFEPGDPSTWVNVQELLSAVETAVPRAE